MTSTGSKEIFLTGKRVNHNKSKKINKLLNPVSYPSLVNLLNMPRPDNFCFVQSAAEGSTPLNAFDNALLNAGIGDLNLIRMSSIIPPGAIQVDRENLDFPAGGFIPIAYTHVDSNSAGQFISAAVAVGIPEGQNQAGVIMELGEHERLVHTESIAREMVRNAFKNRNRELKEIRSTGIEHRVEKCGAVFTGVVLWWSEESSSRYAGGSR